MVKDMLWMWVWNTYSLYFWNGKWIMFWVWKSYSSYLVKIFYYICRLVKDMLWMWVRKSYSSYMWNSNGLCSDCGKVIFHIYFFIIYYILFNEIFIKNKRDLLVLWLVDWLVDCLNCLFLECCVINFGVTDVSDA